MLIQNHETIDAMNQSEVRSYLRDLRKGGEISINLQDHPERSALATFGAFVNGQLAGFTTADLKAVAKARQFPLAGMTLPAVGGDSPKAETKPAPTTPAVDPKTASRAEILDQLLSGVSREECEAIAERIVKERIPADMPERVVIVKEGKTVAKFEAPTHRAFDLILSILASGEDVYSFGPSGTGKTELGRQLAKALGRPFFFTSKISAEHHLTGYCDAKGDYHSTAFFEAFTKGGLFMFDELDASNCNVLTRLNAGLENRIFDFPHGNFEAHPDFICFAAGNTDLRGATREYNGRQQQDAALAERFLMVPVGYDEKLENAIAGGKYGQKGLDVAKKVQAIREAVKTLKVRLVVSMRATIKISKLLSLGVKSKDAFAAALWKGWDSQTVVKVGTEAAEIEKKRAEKTA